MRRLPYVPTLVTLSAFMVFACGDQPNPTEGSVAQLDASLAGIENNKGKIVFASNGDIHVMNADGSGLKNLTDHPAHDTEPSWSRNGKKIVFTSNRRNPDAPFLMQDVWLMNADGSDVRRVTTSDASDFNPQMSPNGKRIAFTRGHQPPPFPGVVPQIFVINLDGTGETNLTNNAAPSCFPFGPVPCVFENYPRWSPNGKQILFNGATVPGDFDIYVMNANGSGRTNLTNSPGRNDFFADWSPSGKEIALTIGPARSPDLDIYVMNADGSGLRQLTTDGAAGVDIAPVWSPNGKKIAFHSARGGAPDIFTINRDGSNEIQLTTNPGPDTFPSWASGSEKDDDDGS